jgi:hypothetical protein
MVVYRQETRMGLWEWNENVGALVEILAMEREATNRYRSKAAAISREPFTE